VRDKFAYRNEYVATNKMAHNYSGREAEAEAEAAPNETHEFHKSHNTDIEVFFLYVGGKTVESVHKTTHSLDEGAVFPKGDVTNMVRRRRYLNKTKYKLISLLRYSITVEPDEAMGIVYDGTETGTGTGAQRPHFLHIERHIEDIHFADNVNAFQHTNSVFFVFSRDHPKSKKRENRNETKRIIFNDRLRKTKRRMKKLKDTRNL
tara:strand:- start:24 stop:638 length:615 start_codon:yes stop_codon:yes gene_type:complete